MREIAHVIDAVITLRDQFSTHLQTINRNLSSLERHAIRAKQSIARTSREFTKAGSAMVKGITLPVAAVGIASAKAAIDFESSFAGVKKTVDGSTEDFAKLRQGILDLSEKMPQSASEIAGVAEAAGQLGIKKEAILDFSKTMVMLGDATNLTADEAATSFARFANITKMPQTEFDKLGSVVVALGNNLATTEQEITAMGMRLAGAGSQVGLSQAQIMSFAGALSSVGIEAEAGGSAFSKVMIDMQLATQTGGDSLHNFATVAGMSSKQFQEAFKKDAAGAMTSFIKGLGEAKKHGTTAIKVLDDMGITEVRLRDTLLRAAGAGDLFNESLKIGTNAWKENNALQNEVNQRYETTESKLKMLKNKLVNLAIKIGDILLPTLQKLTDKFSNIIDYFSKLNPHTQESIVKFALIAAAIGPVLLVIGKLSFGIFRTIDNFNRLSRSIRRAGGIMKWLTSPGSLVVMAIAAILIIGALLIVHWNDIKEAAKKVKKAFVNLKEKGLDKLKNSIKFLKEKLKDLKKKLIEIKDKAIDKVKEGLKKLTDTFKEHQKAIKNTAIVLGVIFGPALIKTGIKATIAGAKLAGSFIANIIKTGTQAVINGTKLTISFVGSLIKTGTQAVINGSKLTVSFIGAVIKTGVQGTIAGVKLTAGFIAAIIKTGLQAAKTAAIITGKLIISIIQFALEGWKAVAAIAAQTAAWLIQKGLILTHTIGIIAYNVAMGVLSGATAICTAAQWAMNAAFLATPIGWICIGIAAIVAAVIGLYQAWVHNWGGIQDKVKSVVEKIKGWWNGLKEFLAHPIQGTINLIKTGSVSGKKEVDGENALGTPYWGGGYSLVGEHGPEIVELPKGSKVNDTKTSKKMMSSNNSNGGIVINISNMHVRQESDIDSIAIALANKIKLELLNMA